MCGKAMTNLRFPIPGYVRAPPPAMRTRCDARIVGTAVLGREATIDSGPGPMLSLAEVKPSRKRLPDDWIVRSEGGRWSKSGGSSRERGGRSRKLVAAAG